MKRWFRFDGPLQHNQLTCLQEALCEGSSERQIEVIDKLLTPVRLREFQRLIVGSEFAFAQYCKHPDWLIDLLQQLERSPSSLVMAPDLPLEAIPALPLSDFDALIRSWRNRAMANLIWQDLNNLCSLPQLTEALTALAETAITTVLHFHYDACVERWGRPVDGEGVVQPMLVVGLGKLGAWELNLSSDVDLMFAYPNRGKTDGATAIDNQEFFSRLGKCLIKSLDAMTQEGFVFRVDMRLRPYGSSGALVSCFDALEDYYQTQGREWERFAMIKARVVASNAVATGSVSPSAVAPNGAVTKDMLAPTDQLMHILNQFTYRRYVDYSAIAALRDLKQRISKEVVRRGLESNIKLGSGGIREIEFIVQAFQVIRGGRDVELQERRVLSLLPLLDCLPSDVSEQLATAYVFLRNVEHALQAFNDRQTQTLPVSDHAQNCLAFALGFDSYKALLRELELHRSAVALQFQAVIAEPKQLDETNQAAPEGDLGQSFHGVWQELSAQPDSALETLEHAGFEHAPELARILKALVLSSKLVSMDKLGRARLDALMPHILVELNHLSEPVVVLARLVDLIKAVARRSAYLVLLTENPGARKQLITLVEASPWVAQQLASHPALLDELLDPTTLYHVPSKAELQQELQQELLRVSVDDLEAQMEGLRYFRSAHALRVAACEITGRMALMRVSDYLTELAEVLLSYVLNLAWQEMLVQHGYPGEKPGLPESEQPQFAIIGYGKLGGLELAHGSDLDLVFIHDAEAQGVTSGNAQGLRSIENQAFYARLGQKIIHILNAQTLGGQLYEVDMRLRPSGNSGLLVSSITAFERYQRDSAWTWEHQALVRARVIVGDEALGQRISAIRGQVLRRVRDLGALKKDVAEMRQKMRQQLGTSAKQQAEGLFDLKQDAGGIVDIEFMVQYAVLAWSHLVPALGEYTDNIRILGCLQDSGQLQPYEVNQLIEAYKVFRSLGHKMALQQHSVRINTARVKAERDNVKAVWLRLLGA